MLAVLVGEDPAVDCCRSQGGIELQGPAVVAPGLVAASQGLGGAGAIEVTFGGIGSEGDAGAERGQGIVKLPQAVGTEPLVEVGPEILGPLVEDALKIEGGLAEPAGRRRGASLVVVVQRGKRVGHCVVGLSRPAPVPWPSTRRRRSSRAAGPAPGIREVEEPQGIPSGRIGLGRRGEPHRSSADAIARSSRSVRIDLLRPRVEGSGV